MFFLGGGGSAGRSVVSLRTVGIQAARDGGGSASSHPVYPSSLRLVAVRLAWCGQGGGRGGGGSQVHPSACALEAGLLLEQAAPPAVCQGAPACHPRLQGERKGGGVVRREGEGSAAAAAFAVVADAALRLCLPTPTPVHPCAHGWRCCSRGASARGCLRVCSCVRWFSLWGWVCRSPALGFGDGGRRGVVVPQAGARARTRCARVAARCFGRGLKALPTPFFPLQSPSLIVPTPPACVPWSNTGGGVGGDARLSSGTRHGTAHEVVAGAHRRRSAGAAASRPSAVRAFFLPSRGRVVPRLVGLSVGGSGTRV